MHDWNVVATARPGRYAQARAWLERLGPVAETGYYNVLVMRVDDPLSLPERVLAARDPDFDRAIGRLVPVVARFRFQRPEEFEARARQAAEGFADALAGRSFHVRMHRRGFRGRLSSQHEEQFLDHHLLETLAARGAPGRIDFRDPDAILVVESLGQEAGMSLWTREQMARYPFLRPD